MKQIALNFFLSFLEKTQFYLNLQGKRKSVEKLLVSYHHIFGKHRFDVGLASNFSVRLKPEHDRPVYSACPPAPIDFRDDILVELALMTYFGIVKPLTYSKNSSPLFCQRKPSGKLRMLIDLRKINHLIRHDYESHNFPISTLADAGNHLAGKTLFAKLDCRQAYHCIPMADELSIQLLAFNFGARTYAFSRLAQGLSRAPTAFCSFARQHLDPCIAKDICYQYMDDIGCGASSVKDLLEKLDEIFPCINKSGLKLSPAKCEFGVKSLQFLGNLITANGLTPDKNKVTKFLNDLEMPKTTKQVKRIIGFLQFFRAFIPKLQQHLLPFYKLLKNNQKFIITQEHHECLDILKKSLVDANKMSLRFPLKDKEFVIMTDASMHAAGYVLLIEDYIQNEGNAGEKRQYAPVMFGSHAFNDAQLKMSINCKEFLAVYYAFENFCHLIWGCSKKVVVLTDNRSLVQFFQAKHIPRNLWLMVDRLMSYDFLLGHIPGKANAAADFLSRVSQKPNEAIEQMIRNTIPIQQIEIEFKTN